MQSLRIYQEFAYTLVYIKSNEIFRDVTKHYSLKAKTHKTHMRIPKKWRPRKVIDAGVAVSIARWNDGSNA